ncbi:YigZ family protein [Brachybacterium halotolerans subsp. kimchii]|uniref:IMPACT family protein n=1 Tax=Brachybacterium halotolerans TaxID=2795215 RepID=UPI001E577BE9|nr:YigZ family protein [Brachybacterium halotolerans]UEJ83903.1 YigZ family protein [Brachybacterium halotolerans subsp. kimchii]
MESEETPTETSPPPSGPAPVRTLARPVEDELIEKKSRFLAQLHPVSSTEEADALLRAARAAHPGARHHCSALVLSEQATGSGPVQRSNDDGEPSGTAGMPILQALLHADLTDTLAIVVRWFGGVKLGAGGLVRAYTAAVEQALDGAPLLERVQRSEIALEVPFTDVGLAENAVRHWADVHGAAAEVHATEYAEAGARLRLLIDPALAEDLDQDVAAWSQGRFVPREIGRRSADVPVPPSTPR